ncbi:MAG: hypothetical protein ABI462_09195, partial [Ignavibacteria bacterium]
FSFGGEKDIEADFKEDMKENLWRSKVKAAGINFSKASGIILTGDNSTNDFEDRVVEEFTRNNFFVFRDTIFTGLKGKENKVESLLEDMKAKTKDDKRVLFYKINLTPAEFGELDKKIYALKKAGYRFYTFGDLQKKINLAKEKKTVEK